MTVKAWPVSTPERRVTHIRRNITGYRALLFVISSLMAMDLFAQTFSGRELADLSLEELANIKITSVSRSAEPLSGAPLRFMLLPLRIFGVRVLHHYRKHCDSLPTCKLRVLTQPSTQSVHAVLTTPSVISYWYWSMDVPFIRRCFPACSGTSKT